MSLSDQDVLDRNASAYWITIGLFVGSLILPRPFFYLLGLDDGQPWPSISSLILSAVLPVAYLFLRQSTGGPAVEEFLRYCELKGSTRKLLLSLYAAWVLIVVTVFVAGLMS